MSRMSDERMQKAQEQLQTISERDYQKSRGSPTSSGPYGV
jgi:hypothetical protein